MVSERLKYRAVAPSDVTAFHSLLQDEHVRRYLLDGSVVSMEWCMQQIHDSQRLFAERGVGTWLTYDKTTDQLVGFCGFDNAGGKCELHLTYALLEPLTGRGLAQEMARAAIAQACKRPGFREIMTTVDEVNVASVRVLEKLGFERIDVEQGAFGNLLVYRLATAR
jgi:ribosomal-protein-alanine N-acetyltransferase